MLASYGLKKTEENTCRMELSMDKIAVTGSFNSSIISINVRTLENT